jgi:hypothetical protein
LSPLRQGVLARLIVIILLFSFFSDSCSRYYTKSNLSPTGNLSRVEISRAGDSFTINLKRDGSVWLLALDDTGAYPVKKERMADFLSVLSRRQTVVTVGTNNREYYGIGIAGSITVTLFNGHSTSPKRLDFGNTDATGEWTYFSRAEDTIYRVSSDIVPFLDIAASSWVNLFPYRNSFTSSDIQRIVIIEGGKSSEYRAGRNSEIPAFQASLAGFSAIDITNYTSAPTLIVEITLGNMKETRMEFFPIGDDWILNDTETGCSYVVTGTSMKTLFSGFITSLSR